MRFNADRLRGKSGMLPSFAAAMAFYFLVSLVPFLIVVTRTVAWFFSTNLAPDLAGFLREVLPPESHLHPDALAAAILLVLVPVARDAMARMGGGVDVPNFLAAAVRYPVAISLMLAAFTLTYAFIPEPAHRPSWRGAALGGFVAAVAWTYCGCWGVLAGACVSAALEE